MNKAFAVALTLVGAGAVCMVYESFQRGYWAWVFLFSAIVVMVGALAVLFWRGVD